MSCSGLLPRCRLLRSGSSWAAERTSRARAQQLVDDLVCGGALSLRDGFVLDA
jgi:hypothetical protein